ncbi:hypothetical protein [Pseudonocardia cypriaca]|uniref:Uncharacterized protein n=1 Tax=Pseudonocardia cypriaca TaxID=882449 RepID=A0A543FTJ3_9PSEU|nr:hypothetical protein [Pseudonocardia cypriaca]TQM37151.1 hypothetical protein FB388_4355 [Pseudonocardia cypriaca]
MTVPMPGPPPRTADPLDAVQQAVSALEGLADRPLGEHVEAYERVHTALSDALAAGSSGGA